MSYTVQLKDRSEVAERTMAFYFERPPGFSFAAGQAVDVTLLDPPETDAEGNVRAFTIASAPEEPDLMVARRMRDTAFKRVLKKLPLGAQVEIDGPWGTLVLPAEAERPAVFLAGGIGITPFRSMAVHATRNKRPQQILLFYSNRRPEDAAFLEELERLEKDNARYKLVATMTEVVKSKRPWQGETGYINPPMLARFTTGLATPIYYVAGPPGMVAGLRKVLKEAGVNDCDIRYEDFSGY